MAGLTKTVDTVTVSGYTIIKWVCTTPTVTGTDTWTCPSLGLPVSYLAVAGGGGGAANYGGGGGAGGLLAGTQTGLLGSITITVGRGGIGGVYTSGTGYTTLATNGDNSVFSSVTAIGGGKGADLTSAGIGGSGGGGWDYTLMSVFPGTSGQGYRGGTCTYRYSYICAGAGRGAGAVGGDGFNGGAGVGGSGLQTNITGVSTYYAGGGGGGAGGNGYQGGGDSGGGGAGGGGANWGNAGTNGLGGGGGGGGGPGTLGYNGSPGGAGGFWSGYYPVFELTCKHSTYIWRGFWRYGYDDSGNVKWLS